MGRALLVGGRPWVPWDPDACAAAVGVPVDYEPFDTALGMYLVTRSGGPTIGLRSDLAEPRNERTRRITLAHELGHHAVTTGDLVLYGCRPGTKAVRSKHEIAAERWAAERLCPPELVRAVFRQHDTIDRGEIALLADLTLTTPEFVTWWCATLQRTGRLRDGRSHPDPAWVPTNPTGSFADLR